MAEKIRFRVDSEWLTGFVRQRVYYEGVSFQDGVKMLTSSVQGLDDSTATCVLTGSKKLVGVDNIKIVNDNATEEFVKYQKRLNDSIMESEIDEEVKNYPLKYLDIFTTVVSPKYYKESLDHEPTLDEVNKWFITGSATMDDLFAGGTYSINSMFIDKPINSFQDTLNFYEGLYKYWQKELDKAFEMEKSYSKPDIERIKIRQKKYLMWKERHGLKSGKTGKTFEFSDYGIITPEGDFMSCDFGTHSSTAYDYCLNVGWMKLEDEDDGITSDMYAKAKDILYKAGFVFVNEVSHRFYSKYGLNPEDFPQAIQNTCYEYLAWMGEEDD